MIINLKIYLPMLSDVVGTDKVKIDLQGGTAEDLLKHLARTYGKKAADAIYDKQGKLDLEVQLLINHKTWVTRENIDHVLQDGDAVQIMVMMGGG